MESKNKVIEKYIKDLAEQVNYKYNGLIDEEKISNAIEMFKDSEDDLQLTIFPKINEMFQEVIENYLEFKRQLEAMMESRKQQFEELAVLDLNTNLNGIFLSQQQIDLLMITELKTKEEIKEYIENICSQFPNKSVEDIIENYDNLTEEQIEEAKRGLYQEYQDSLVNYLSYAQMNNVEKAKINLERLGVSGAELDNCLSKVSQGQISETLGYLEQKYGNGFITKFNRLMTNDFDNIKSISYDEMKSLSELIQRDDTLDTIIIATGTFNNSVYGNAFDPYFTNKALQYCLKHGKHMRYHTLFDQGRVERLIEQGKGLKDHDQILAEMRAFVKISMDYIKIHNVELPDGTMLINEIEIFNELVERNKDDKNSPYEMVWEKHFGVTIEEIVSCFDGIEKPTGVEFMYNETTLTESPLKRDKVEKVLDRIIEVNPNLIDRFGDQMHLSDEDVITQNGRKNLQETAQLIRRIQDKKIFVNGREKHIKTECTEHDFHFTKHFLKNADKLKKSGEKVDLWQIKRTMQDYVGKTYVSNGVKFERSTYWSLFGKNDHNLVRTNKKIQKENQANTNEKKHNSLIDTMSAGMIKDGRTFTNIKSLNNEEKKEQTEKKQDIMSIKPTESKTLEFKIVKEKKKEREQGQSNFGEMSPKKQEVYKQQKETTKSNNETKTVDKPKTLMLNKSGNSNNGNSSNGSSNSGGFVNMAFMISIIILTSFVAILFVYHLISG